MRALLVLAVGYTVYVARPVLLPLAVALLLALLLRPPVSGLRRLRVPKAVGAALVLALLLCGVGLGVWKLRAPALEWIEQAPRTMDRLERKLSELRRPVERVTRAAEQVEQLATGGAPAAGSQVQVEPPGVVAVAMTGLWHFAAGLVVVLVLVFLLLVYDDVLLARVVAVLPRLQDKRRAVLISREVEAQVSRYLFTATVINVCEGIAVGLALHVLDVPNPWLWGAMAAVLNYVPYLGALLGIAIVAVVALLSLDSLPHALAAPAAYAAINLLEGMLISPVVVGKRFELNPVIVFVWLFFWGWTWGIGGALIAVPLLAATKIVCDHVPGLAPVAELLSGDRGPAAGPATDAAG